MSFTSCLDFVEKRHQITGVTLFTLKKKINVGKEKGKKRCMWLQWWILVITPSDLGYPHTHTQLIPLNWKKNTHKWS